MQLSFLLPKSTAQIKIESYFSYLPPSASVWVRLRQKFSRRWTQTVSSFFMNLLLTILIFYCNSAFKTLSERENYEHIIYIYHTGNSGCGVCCYYMPCFFSGNPNNKRGWHWRYSCWTGVLCRIPEDQKITIGILR